MTKWKAMICGASCALILSAGITPIRAAMPRKPLKAPQQIQTYDFQNPQGITVDLIYIQTETDGQETIVKTVKRVIIPVGTIAVTPELQQQLLPEGWKLKDPAELPLEEDTLEVKIPVEPLSVPEAPTDPTVPPQDPTEKPTEPQEPGELPTEPQKPSEKPAEPEKPSQKPTEPEKPVQRPDKPSEKPQKPSQKPDPTNPKTGDSFSPAAWILPGTAAGALLLWIRRRKASRS